MPNLTRDLPAVPRAVSTPDGRHHFEGALLGVGTSRRDSHLDHPPGTAPTPGQRCSGCRWTEVKIFWSVTDGQYLVHIVGHSILPGETQRIRLVWARTADAVLDSLLAKLPRRQRDSNPGVLELPQPNHDALQEAADVDPDLNSALQRWRRETRA